MKAAGYGRVSTLKQIEGTSIEDQRNRIEKECKKEGYDLHRFFHDDGFSGSSMENRPGIQELIRDAGQGKFEHLFFTKLDRVGRNLRELLEFWDLMESHDLKLHCIDDPSVSTEGKMGKVIRGILGTFAEFERDLIKERVHGGRRIKWEEGTIFVGGAAPYGYKFNKEKGRMEIQPDEAEVYKKMVSLYLDSNYSFIDIANRLTEEAVLTPSARRRKRAAKSWNSSQIGKILRNEAFKGKAIYNRHYSTGFKTSKKTGRSYMKTSKDLKPKDQWITYQFPPLISEDRWNQLQAKIDHKKQRTKKHHADVIDHFLCENILFCGECGSKMKKHVNRQPQIPQLRYICFFKDAPAKRLQEAGRERCKSKSVNADGIDERIFNQIVEIISDPGKFAEAYMRDVDLEELKAQIKNLTDRKSQLENKLERAYDLITEIDDRKLVAAYKVKLKKDQESLRSTELDLKRAQNELDNHTNKTDRLDQFKKAMAKANKRAKAILSIKTKGAFKSFLHSLPFKDKKRIVESVIGPENGGKVRIRWPMLGDLVDDYEGDPADLDEKVMNSEPLVEMDFQMDLGRITALLTDLNKSEFLDIENKDSLSVK